MIARSPKIAVLLAAYNGIHWIEEQLVSILEQSGVDVSVYISVDVSNDGTESWCEVYAAKHPEVTVLPSVGGFGGAARNFFRLLRDVDFDGFDFIAFADQDDIWHVNKLQNASSQLKAKGADAYSSNVTAFWADGRTRLLDKAQHQVRWDYLFEAAGPGCTYVMQQRLAQQLKELICSNWSAIQNVTLHDWFCYAFARSYGYRWFIDPLPSMLYRQHERNQVGANTGLNAMLTRYRTIHDGWWFDQVRLITRLVGKDSDPFVIKWFALRRGQLFYLSLSSWKCRRRMRDKFLFSLVCCAGALFGGKKEL